MGDIGVRSVNSFTKLKPTKFRGIVARMPQLMILLITIKSLSRD